MSAGASGGGRAENGPLNRTSPLVGRKALVAKLGIDAHWRGAIVVAKALRDAGMEVVYLGHASPSQVAAAAIQEDVDVVGLSSLSGNHMIEATAVLDELRRGGGQDMIVVVGGTIPARDAQILRERGASDVFPTGSSLSRIRGRLAELLDTGAPTAR
ncbi:MAG: cobalamin B12-binding domain-containing protein [Trebonia sp.]